MTPEQKQEIERLFQGQRLTIIREPRATAFVHVYSSQSSSDGFHCYSFFLPSHQRASFLADVAWDKHCDSFTPHVECCNKGRDDERVYYVRDGNEDGAQAFIHWRTFPNSWPSAIEVCEEFRLFFNLFHLREKDVYLHCDVKGIEHEVVRVTKDRVEVSLRFLSEFLVAKQMDLALQYEGNYWSKIPLSDLGLRRANEAGRNDIAIWDFTIGESKLPEAASMSRLLGKAIISCPRPLEWNDPYEEKPEDFQTFIVGQDTSGNPIFDTCDYEQIHNTYNRAMAPIFFKKAVLAKYYNEPHRYEIKPTGLWCGSSWHLNIDHDSPKYVTVFLKHLADLPAAEREHWKIYNVTPDGGISDSSFIRNIRGWWADAAMPDIIFKSLYGRTNKEWERTYGWPLWLEPQDGDAHLLRQAHVCLESSQAEFDQMNSIVAKLLCDFLNEKSLQASLFEPQKGQEKIQGRANQLRAFLEQEGFSDATDNLGPFFAFQALRSSGSAHRKTDDYDKKLKRAGLLGVPNDEASFILFAKLVGSLKWILTCLEKKRINVTRSAM